MERFRHALISSDDAWLQFFYPAPKQVSRVEVTEEEVEKEGITFEFEHMDPSVAEDLLAQVMEQAKQGTVKVVDEDWR